MQIAELTGQVLGSYVHGEMVWRFQGLERQGTVKKIKILNGNTLHVQLYCDFQDAISHSSLTPMQLDEIGWDKERDPNYFLSLISQDNNPLVDISRGIDMTLRFINSLGVVLFITPVTIRTNPWQHH